MADEKQPATPVVPLATRPVVELPTWVESAPVAKFTLANGVVISARVVMQQVRKPAGQAGANGKQLYEWDATVVWHTHDPYEMGKG